MSLNPSHNIPSHDILILAYFRQSYEHRVEISPTGQTQLVRLTEQPFADEALHLAWSRDGRHWQPFNGNNPVWPEQWMRDPFVGRGPDGAFHLVVTVQGNYHSRACLYARSRDLISWEEVRLLPVMERVAAAHNVWAPEWAYDEEQQEYLLFWSSSFAEAGWKESRLWCCRTRDFETFTEPLVMFEPPYSVIDGSLVHDRDSYYLFHKEEFGAVKGERRAIRLAVSQRSDGPYILHQGPLNGGQIVPIITEGPTVFPDPLQPGWILTYDFCMSDNYGSSWSPDLLTWSELPDVSFPASARHGSVIPITEAEWKALLEKWNSMAVQ